MSVERHQRFLTYIVDAIELVERRTRGVLALDALIVPRACGIRASLPHVTVVAIYSNS